MLSDEALSSRHPALIDHERRTGMFRSCELRCELIQTVVASKHAAGSRARSGASWLQFCAASVAQIPKRAQSDYDHVIMENRGRNLCFICREMGAVSLNFVSFSSSRNREPSKSLCLGPGAGWRVIGEVRLPCLSSGELPTLVRLSLTFLPKSYLLQGPIKSRSYCLQSPPVRQLKACWASQELQSWSLARRTRVGSETALRADSSNALRMR